MLIKHLVNSPVRPRPPRKRPAAGRRPDAGQNVGGSRSSILTAARRIFAQRGYEGTTIREVSEAAGVNTAMIYYHFQDKVRLYRAVLADSFHAFDRIWDEPVFASSASSREKVQAYLIGLIRFHGSNDELRRIVSIELASCGENSRWLADKFFKHGYKRLSAILEEGMRSGELQKADLRVAVACLVGMVFHIFTMRPLAEYITGRRLDLSPESLGAFLTGLYVDGLGTAARKRNRS